MVMAKRKPDTTPNSTRRRLRVIRETQGWRTASDVAGIPKRIRVKNPNNKSGFGYKTLTDNQRYHRLQKRVQTYQAGDKAGRVVEKDSADISKTSRKRIKRAMEGISLEDRVKAGRRVDVDLKIRQSKREIKDLDAGKSTGQIVMEDTAREEMLQARREAQENLQDLQDRRRSEDEDNEVWEAYQTAQDNDDSESWENFRGKYSSQ
jgi:hypothetical protein